MLNVLSGLQEGSRSVVVISRLGTAGLVKGQVVATGATANTVAAADGAVANFVPMVEYIFEDLLTQTSGKYTCIYGDFEAETDQFSGSPAIGSYLKPGTAGTAGKLVAALAAEVSLVVGKVIDTYTLPVNPTMLAGVGGVAVTVIRFRAR